MFRVDCGTSNKEESDPFQLEAGNADGELLNSS